MSKYCPIWIIDCIIAEASIEFIELEVGLEFISKKYTEGIRNIYEDVENVNILSLSCPLKVPSSSNQRLGSNTSGLVK